MRRRHLATSAAGLLLAAAVVHCSEPSEDAPEGPESGVPTDAPPADAPPTPEAGSDAGPDVQEAGPAQCYPALDASIGDDAGDPTVTNLVAGADHTCALWSDGVAKCWGKNTFGQLGVCDTTDRGAAPGQMGAALPAVRVAPGRKVTAISAGGDTTCVVDDRDEASCFGANGSGQLGSNLGKVSAFAPGVPSRFSSHANSAHACDVSLGGAGPDGWQCWGANAFGQLGLGDTNHRGDDPGEMATLPRVPFPASWGGMQDLYMSRGPTASHTCLAWRVAPGVEVDAKIACWGHNDKGQLGLGDTTNRGTSPGSPPALVDIGVLAPRRLLLVAAGRSHTCVIVKPWATFGTTYVKCFGDNSRGQLGTGDAKSHGAMPNEMGDSLPPVIGEPGPYDDKFGPIDSPYLALGDAHSCSLAVHANGDRFLTGYVHCWGANDVGQLGQGDTVDRGRLAAEMPPPDIDVGTDRRVMKYASGANHVCAVLEDGKTIKCWGKNDVGQLGLGDKNHRGDQPNEMGDALPPVSLR